MVFGRDILVEEAECAALVREEPEEVKFEI